MGFSFYKDTMWFTLVLGLCLVSSIHGFSEGAGTSACKGNLQMKPGHQNLEFENNDDKISIEAERESDDTLKITITTSEAFRGYLVVVQDKSEEDGGKPIGEFVLSGSNHNGLRCTSKNSGLTHSYPHKSPFGGDSILESLEATWKIPENYDGSSVLVRATVLYEYSRAGHQRKEVSI